MLWNSTHRDITPNPLTYDESWNRTVAYATAIKGKDPDAKVLGPVVWGWCAYFSSASDAASGVSCVDGPDRQAHGGLPYLEYDGSGSRIDGDAIGAYAIRGSDDTLWVLLFNKDSTARQAQVAITGTMTGGAEGYRFDPTMPLSGIGPVTLGDAGFELELPPRSATLVVAHLEPGALFADGFGSGDTSVWSAAVF